MVGLLQDEEPENRRELKELTENEDSSSSIAKNVRSVLSLLTSCELGLFIEPWLTAAVNSDGINETLMNGPC